MQKNSIIDVYLGSKYTFGMFPSATNKVVAPLSGDQFHTQYEISNPTKWSNTPKQFECVLLFCRVGA